jgi:hypothetical protein
MIEWDDKYLDVHCVGDSLQLRLARRDHAALPILSSIQRGLDLKSRRALYIEVSSNDDAFAVYIWIDGVGTFVLDTYRYFTSATVEGGKVWIMALGRAEKTM